MINHRFLPTGKLPDWIFTLAKDGCVNAKELAQIYNVSKSVFHRWVDEGLYPKPDMVSKSFAPSFCKPTHLWRVSTVIKFAKEHHDH